MIKRREETKSGDAVLSQEQIENFAAGAEQYKQDSIDEKSEDTFEINPNAKRDFKAIRVPFNEYEYRKLEEIAQKTGRTKLNLIRWAVLQFDE